MKNKLPKSAKRIFIAVAVLAIAFFCRRLLFSALWFVAITVFTIIGGLAGLLTLPPLPPEIQYAEMPFELVYEIDGEVNEIKDTLVCEYNGWKNTSGGLGKQRCWSKHLKSGSDITEIYNDGETKISLEFFSAATYMGDPDGWDFASPGFNESDYTINEPIFLVACKDGFYGRITKAELFEKFGIVVVSYDLPECIENSFSTLNVFRRKKTDFVH